MIDKRFMKFLFVGLLNTIFGYSIFALFIFLNVHYSIASLLSTVLGVIFNFKTISKLVFKNNNNALIFKFIGVYTVIYIVNISFLRIFKTLSVNMYIAGGILVLPLAILSFILNKKYVFKERK